MVKKIGLIAGGTGVTPMLQVIREVLSNPADFTELSLIFANVSEADILLRDELDALAYLYPNFRVYCTLDKVPASGWNGGSGFVNMDMIARKMPRPTDDCLILVCGPKGMMEHVSGNKEKVDVQGPLSGLLKEAGFTESQVYKF
jgi:cytochrome-b5 reductase